MKNIRYKLPYFLPPLFLHFLFSPLACVPGKTSLLTIFAYLAYMNKNISIYEILLLSLHLEDKLLLLESMWLSLYFLLAPISSLSLSLPLPLKDRSSEEADEQTRRMRRMGKKVWLWMSQKLRPKQDPSSLREPGFEKIRVSSLEFLSPRAQSAVEMQARQPVKNSEQLWMSNPCWSRKGWWNTNAHKSPNITLLSVSWVGGSGAAWLTGPVPDSPGGGLQALRPDAESGASSWAFRSVRRGFCSNNVCRPWWAATAQPEGPTFPCKPPSLCN